MTFAELAPVDIPPPEPDLTPEEMLRRAEAMRPVLRERQALCERLGRLPEETNQDFLRAGFYRVVQPRCFGGYEFFLPDFIRVMMEVARGCPESGLVLSLTAGHPESFIAGFSEQAPARGLLAKRRCPRSWRLCSGWRCDAGRGRLSDKGGVGLQLGLRYRHSFFLGAMIALDPETQAPRRYIYVLLDRGDFAIADNWDTSACTARVPSTSWWMKCSCLRIASSNSAMPASAVSRSDPPIPVLRTTSVVVGAARGALEIYEQILRERKSILPPFTARVEMDEYQHHFGHAQALIDTAGAALLKLGSNYMVNAKRAMEGDASKPEEERGFQRMTQQCVELAWEAVDLMFRTAGSSVAKKTSALARYFRNLAVIRTHITVQLHHTSTNVGRLHFGLPPLSTLRFRLKHLEDAGLIRQFGSLG